jgi:branched-chain amino acid transport system substrate-binding protein
VDGGLGNHVAKTMKVDEVAVVAGDYAFPYAQVFGFSLEYCGAGGKATYLWSPLGTTDFSTIIARIPKTAGALLVVHGGTDGLAFMTQYAQAGGSLPLLGGSIMADQTMMSARGPHRKLLTGMISSGPIADIHDDPTWNEFVARYQKRWGSEGFQSPSIHGVNYATNLQAVLRALDQVGGDLSGNQQAFQAALSKVEFKNPMGANVRLDENRQAISDVFMNRIEERGGQLRTVTFQRTPAVTQTLGLPRDKFMALGAPSRDNPGCVARSG